MESKELRAKKYLTRRLSAKSIGLLFPFVLIFTLHALLPTSVSCQDDDLAPPPLKVITKAERMKLDGEGNLKAKTQVAVEMLKLRLAASEKMNFAEDFDGMFRELGHFRGILDYTLGFLEQQDPRQNKTLDNYKRLELFIRAATPRLETIRREVPLRYEDYIRELSIYFRDARRRVLEPLFGDTVIPGSVKN